MRPLHPTTTTPIHLFVHTPSDDIIALQNINKDALVRELKRELELKGGVIAELQDLYVNSSKLDDLSTFRQSEVKSGCMLRIRFKERSLDDVYSKASKGDLDGILKLGVEGVKDCDKLTAALNQIAYLRAYQAVFAACWRSRVNIVTKLLRQGTLDVRAVTKNGRSLLHVAAYAGNLMCVGYLLGEGVDAKLKDVEGFTALELAARNGHLKVEKRILLHLWKLEEVQDNKLQIKWNSTKRQPSPLLLPSICADETPVTNQHFKPTTPLPDLEANPLKETPLNETKTQALLEDIKMVRPTNPDRKTRRKKREDKLPLSNQVNVPPDVNQEIIRQRSIEVLEVPYPQIRLDSRASTSLSQGFRRSLEVRIPSAQETRHDNINNDNSLNDSKMDKKEEKATAIKTDRKKPRNANTKHEHDKKSDLSLETTLQEPKSNSAIRNNEYFILEKEPDLSTLKNNTNTSTEPTNVSIDVVLKKTDVKPNKTIEKIEKGVEIQKSKTMHKEHQNSAKRVDFFPSKHSEKLRERKAINEKLGEEKSTTEKSSTFNEKDTKNTPHKSSISAVKNENRHQKVGKIITSNDPQNKAINTKKCSVIETKVNSESTKKQTSEDNRINKQNCSKMNNRHPAKTNVKAKNRENKQKINLPSNESQKSQRKKGCKTSCIQSYSSKIYLAKSSAFEKWLMRKKKEASRKPSRKTNPIKNKSKSSSFISFEDWLEGKRREKEKNEPNNVKNNKKSDNRINVLRNLTFEEWLVKKNEQCTKENTASSMKNTAMDSSAASKPMTRAMSFERWLKSKKEKYEDEKRRCAEEQHRVTKTRLFWQTSRFSDPKQKTFDEWLMEKQSKGTFENKQQKRTFEKHKQKSYVEDNNLIFTMWLVDKFQEEMKEEENRLQMVCSGGSFND